MITDATPRHNRRVPSVEDIRVNASDMPVYIAAGEVDSTCIRVYAIPLPRQYVPKLARGS
jgi:hypothetical protein